MIKNRKVWITRGKGHIAPGYSGIIQVYKKSKKPIRETGIDNEKLVAIGECKKDDVWYQYNMELPILSLPIFVFEDLFGFIPEEDSCELVTMNTILERD